MCEVLIISDAAEVQNQLIHKLRDGQGQRVRGSSPGGPWKSRRRQSQLPSHF